MQDVIALPAWERLPDIGLYMDQVLTLMQRTFSPALCTGAITRSMVNNYVKFGLLSRPVGKKYGRDQLAQLVMIALLKQALSMEDVAQALSRLCADGVREGYARFCGLCARAQRAMTAGENEPARRAETADKAAQAVEAGVCAALYTIYARQLLGALGAAGEEA